MADWSEALNAMIAFRKSLPDFFMPADIEAAAKADPKAVAAALALIEGNYVHAGPHPTGGVELQPLLELAAMMLAADGSNTGAVLGRVVFRISHPATYRTLIPLLRIILEDDAALERAVIDALRSDDPLVVARALDVQYHAWGFGNRFRLSDEGAKEVARAVEAVRQRVAADGPVADALANYTPPRP